MNPVSGGFPNLEYKIDTEVKPCIACQVRLNNHSKKEKLMKVTISKMCMGDRNCNNLCPEVFEYDEDQLKSIVKVDVIPEHLEKIVRQAADECGADAITVEE